MFRKKSNVMKVVILLSMITLAMPLWAGGQSEPSGEDGGEKNFVLKFASVSVPGDAHTEAMTWFAEKVEELSNGSIKVKVYHSGSLYSGTAAEYEALYNGDLELAYVAPASLATQIPYFSMLSSGYFFKDYDHMTTVLNGPIGKEKIFKDVEKTLGIKPLAAYYLGSRQINTRENPVLKPEDLEGVLLRMPNSPAWQFLGESLGANPTPLAFTEVYTALSTGAVDGQDNPLPTVYNAKFYEVTKCIAITNHVIDSVWPAVNLEIWNSMSPAQQDAMLKAADYAREKCDTQNKNSEMKFVDFFKSEGMTITNPDISAFRNRVQNYYLSSNEMTSTWDMEIYKKVQEMAQ